MSSALPLARGWQARLALKFEASPVRTQLTRREHVGPLLVQRAFYPEQAVAGAGEPCHVVVLHPPGGVASGDELRVEGGVLEWLPQENIFYPDAAVQLRSIVRLSGAARFIGWEIGCLGLPASARGLDDGALQWHFELWQQARPLLLERLSVSRESLGARWGLAGHVALGTALLFPAGLPELALARASAGANCAELMVACTLVDGVLVCRATARRTDQLKQAFVRWWRALHPAGLAAGAWTRGTGR